MWGKREVEGEGLESERESGKGKGKWERYMGVFVPRSWQVGYVFAQGERMKDKGARKNDQDWSLKMWGKWKVKGEGLESARKSGKGQGKWERYMGIFCGDAECVFVQGELLFGRIFEGKDFERNEKMKFTENCC